VTSAADRSAWLRPGAHEVAAGVVRIPLPLPLDGLRAVNVYALVEGDHVVLVDAGWALEESRTQLVASLRELGLELTDVDGFLVTHVHRDHYTQAVTVRAATGASVALGADEEESLRVLVDGGDHAEDVAQVVLLRRYGAPGIVDGLRRAGWGGPVDRRGWELPDRWLIDGEDVAVPGRTLRVLHTPGHTRGHVVFLDAAGGVLFAGDHVLPHITPSLGFESRPAPSPLADYLRSLAKVRALPDARLLPAHGPVTDSVHARVDELLDHHEDRLRAAEKALHTGAATPYEVARCLRWTRRAFHLNEVDPVNQMLAVIETAAHLDVLVVQGRAARLEDGGVDHYLTAP
jgi:glyoxylase-like metal-dependent hydrolase (beta-lactamase superfamily II)